MKVVRCFYKYKNFAAALLFIDKLAFYVWNKLLFIIEKVLISKNRKENIKKKEEVKILILIQYIEIYKAY
ncbi:hypothetical protein AC231_00975 [Clostridium pasteurianum]|uniref:hypothetical protein n=1 Tax=Clostridium pasteurianum TaxID=1501 RepID=UPI000305F50B|nr:hypothetical protein [Clostridium pasteurianum]AOZ75487.1 hypothetical protein AQ983_10490 [Clostridium pasteurianum DSM 525 = ATCC 6013]AOZ79282.1 hypothetical protein AQ984_10480 [Clostridium pasteurianum]OMH22312.1 hypothetical protein AC231_00975 [Clostridium pasteurianum]